MRGVLPHSSVAQRQSIRLLTGGLLVRIQPEEPIHSTSCGDNRDWQQSCVPCFVPTCEWYHVRSDRIDSARIAERVAGRRNLVDSVGSAYERFVESQMSAFASIVRVPREEDFGIDFYFHPHVPAGDRTLTVADSRPFK